MLRVVITFIYGAVDDLYQKKCAFFKKNFHTLYSINYGIHCVVNLCSLLSTSMPCTQKIISTAKVQLH
jgi:hypothetical protein